MKLQLVLNFLAMATLREIAGYKVCGDNSYKPETAKAIAEVIDRLMAMRNTDWNWKYIHSPMLIQLNGPDKFYEKEKTVDAIRIKLETEADKMSLEDLALHTVTVKGLCKNNTNFFGMDLTEMLKQRMKQQFGYKVKVPKEGISAFSIAMSILCISDVPVGRYFINKWLANQNEDGSFGEGRNKIETTIFTLHPANCLSKDQYQKSMARRLRRVEEKIRNFLISHIKSNYKNGTFTGKPLTGLLAVTTMAQTPSPGEDTETWKCRELMSTIGVTPTTYESEMALVMRLIRISGRGFGHYKHPSWKCPDQVPTPSGYIPKCQPDKPGTCGMLSIGRSAPRVEFPGFIPPGMTRPVGVPSEIIIPQDPWLDDTMDGETPA